MGIEQLYIGILLGAGSAYVAFKAKSLTVSGAWATAITGGVIFGIGGLNWALLLIAFFVSSSLLSRINNQNKTRASEKFAKGGQRDWGQVLANGGIGILLALIQIGLPLEFWMWVAYIGTMATVTADTWATELGTLIKTAPRLITNGRIVESGTSGGISILGVIASLGGGAVIGLLAGLLSSDVSWFAGLIIGAIAGLAGSLMDSFLGATVQAMYFCPRDNKVTEQHPLHFCGTETTLRRGWSWVNNDVVNFVSSVFGAATAVLFWKLLV